MSKGGHRGRQGDGGEQRAVLLDVDLYDVLDVEKELPRPDTPAKASVVIGEEAPSEVTIWEMLRGVKERVSETTRMGVLYHNKKRAPPGYLNSRPNGAWT